MLMLCFASTMFIIIYYHSLKRFHSPDVSKVCSLPSSSVWQMNLHSFIKACFFYHGCAKWSFLGLGYRVENQFSIYSCAQVKSQIPLH